MEKRGEKVMRLMNLVNDQQIANRVGQAYSFHKRLVGLMFTKSLAPGNGLHIKPCRSIHTFFMNYPIDVLFLSEENEVIACFEHFSPRKIGKVIHRASSVVELPAGTIEKTNTKVGHKVQFKKNDEKGANLT
ncbi:DUF192 domain-containing protein [Cytobacillus sp. FJAT-54145]|uniref:DUF192 domain-containing protein n=1 Tax=Cytobacillus spartinae TaxID=3299023 RepID=A0ABW6K8L1_9BACI